MTHYHKQKKKHRQRQRDTDKQELLLLHLTLANKRLQNCSQKTWGMSLWLWQSKTSGIHTIDNWRKLLIQMMFLCFQSCHGVNGYCLASRLMSKWESTHQLCAHLVEESAEQLPGVMHLPLCNQTDKLLATTPNGHVLHPQLITAKQIKASSNECPCHSARTCFIPTFIVQPIAPFSGLPVKI